MGIEDGIGEAAGQAKKVVTGDDEKKQQEEYGEKSSVNDIFVDTDKFNDDDE